MSLARLPRQRAPREQRVGARLRTATPPVRGEAPRACQAWPDWRERTYGAPGVSPSARVDGVHSGAALRATAGSSPNRYVSVGIEGTFEPTSGKDTLSPTGHFRCDAWSRDFELVRELGVVEVRYPVPWHHIERERGRYAWRRLDRIIGNAYDEHGLTLIADPLHHTSYPRWLKGGFLNPTFVPAYTAFVDALAERYPMLRVFTPFNEPTCTLDFCGYRGLWAPYAQGDRSYVTMLRHTVRASAEVISGIRQRHRDAYILHVDTFQRHAALDQASERRARFLNERRFLFEELLTGRVDSAHPLYRYLVRNGFPRRDLEWHLEHAARIDERGGNYYPLNEEQLQNGRTKHAPSLEPLGFAGVVQEYARRLQYPLSLTETNIQGSIRDRISWLKYMLEQSELLQSLGLGLRRFAWYPLFDCCGWSSLLQATRWKRDPQGIFTCDARWARVANELSTIYREVTAGLMSTQIPAYAFSEMHEQALRGLRPHMAWDWVDAERGQ